MFGSHGRSLFTAEGVRTVAKGGVRCCPRIAGPDARRRQLDLCAAQGARKRKRRQMRARVRRPDAGTMNARRTRVATAGIARGRSAAARLRKTRRSPVSQRPPPPTLIANRITTQSRDDSLHY
ncbi:hypothetical protein [Lysobacter gummosus]|uniref:hypothetical protein n=1 Tax=Lysobacter gummosus TaxID=262324 RepID=UPI0036396582